jgi:hypothetical protein
MNKIVSIIPQVLDTIACFFMHQEIGLEQSNK